MLNLSSNLCVTNERGKENRSRRMILRAPNSSHPQPADTQWQSEHHEDWVRVSSNNRFVILLSSAGGVTVKVSNPVNKISIAKADLDFRPCFLRMVSGMRAQPFTNFAKPTWSAESKCKKRKMASVLDRVSAEGVGGGGGTQTNLSRVKMYAALIDHGSFFGDAAKI